MMAKMRTRFEVLKVIKNYRSSDIDSDNPENENKAVDDGVQNEETKIEKENDSASKYSANYENDDLIVYDNVEVNENDTKTTESEEAVTAESSFDVSRESKHDLRDDQSSVSSYSTGRCSSLRSGRLSSSNESSMSARRSKNSAILNITPDEIEKLEKNAKEVLVESANLAEKLKAKVGEAGLSQIGDARVDPNYKIQNMVLTKSGIFVPKGHKQYPNTNCYKCNEAGHEFMDCEVPMEENKVFCIICGQANRKFYSCDHKPRKMRYKNENNSRNDFSYSRNRGQDESNNYNQNTDRNRNQTRNDNDFNYKRYGNSKNDKDIHINQRYDSKRNSNMNNRRGKYNNTYKNREKNEPIDYDSLLKKTSGQTYSASYQEIETMDPDISYDYKSSSSCCSETSKGTRNSHRRSRNKSKTESLHSSNENQELENAICDNQTPTNKVMNLEDFIDEGSEEKCVTAILLLESCLKSVRISGLQVKMEDSEEPIFLQLG